jgi:hypothetical protein
MLLEAKHYSARRKLYLGVRSELAQPSTACVQSQQVHVRWWSPYKHAAPTMHRAAGRRSQANQATVSEVCCIPKDMIDVLSLFLMTCKAGGNTLFFTRYFSRLRANPVISVSNPGTQDKYYSLTEHIF